MPKKIKNLALSLLRFEASKKLLFSILAMFCFQTIYTMIATTINPDLGPNLVEIFRVTVNVYLLEIPTYSLKAGYENWSKNKVKQDSECIDSTTTTTDSTDTVG